MQNSFIKYIQGHPLEFNRILFPLRYNILNKDLESLGLRIWMQQDEKGRWAPEGNTKLPYWFNEITSDIHDAIVMNETS